MEETITPTYLSLSAASRLLGVHATTLRRWADTGAVPVYITPGGHRRFARTDVETIASRARPRDKMALTMHALAHRAWLQAHNDLEQVEQQPPMWLQCLDSVSENERDTWRIISQQLMGIVLRYLSTSDEQEEALLLDRAHAIGIGYAHHAQRIHLSVVHALEAALFFRDSLIAVAVETPDCCTPSKYNNNLPRLLRRLNRLFNTVQLALVASYDERR